MSIDAPILVTGAAGRLGGVGGEIVEILRSRDLPVRALVRTDDDRAEALRATGAEVVIGDLTRAADVARALEGCRRMYFGMSVSAPIWRRPSPPPPSHAPAATWKCSSTSPS